MNEAAIKIHVQVYKPIFLFLLGKSLGVDLLGHIVTLILQRTTTLCSITAASSYISTSSV